MDNYKLKIKIGDNEFEAEGAPEDVQRQFEAFKELIITVPAMNRTAPASAGEYQDSPPANNGSIDLEKVTRVDGRIVSLTGRTGATPDAIMVILLGQKGFRSNEAVTGAEIIDGLKQSGIVVPRIDYTLEKLATDGHVIKIGTGRASRYRLTNQGVARAQEVARAMIAEVS